MTKDELIEKWFKKYRVASEKSAELRRSYHKKKDINPEEAREDWEERMSWQSRKLAIGEMLSDIQELQL